VGTGAVAEHARKPVPKAASLVVRSLADSHTVMKRRVFFYFSDTPLSV
jgi:hypothetical protein